MKAVKSNIAYSTDTWTTPQMVYTFAGTVGTFINEDWDLIEHVVDFKPLAEKEHQGLYGGKAFVHGVHEIGGLNKIGFALIIWQIAANLQIYFISLTADNASVNDVLIATVSCILLTKYGIPESNNHQIRCICHIVNLVIQAILATLGEVDDPTENNCFLLKKDQLFHLDSKMDPDQLALDQEEFQEDAKNVEPENIAMEDEEKLEATQSPLSKVCVHLFGLNPTSLTEICTISSVSLLIAKKSMSTPQQWKKFQQCAIARYPQPNDRRQSLAMVKDIHTCWNYMHTMIQQAQLLQEVGLHIFSHSAAHNIM